MIESNFLVAKTCDSITLEGISIRRCLLTPHSKILCRSLSRRNQLELLVEECWGCDEVVENLEVGQRLGRVMYSKVL